jgi:hypothetical protein
MISICKLFIPFFFAEGQKVPINMGHFFCRRSEGTHQHGSSIPPKYGVNKVHGHVDGYHDRVKGGFMLFLYYYVPAHTKGMDLSDLSVRCL